MSAARLPSATSAAAAAPAAPRALLDYDFPTVLAAPPRHRLVLWLLLVLIGLATGVLALARVDIVIAANGRLVTSDSEIVVKPLETSVVRSVAVRMGDRVKAGAVLATLDPTFSEADESELAAKLGELRATCDRLEAEIAGQAYDPPTPDRDQLTQREIFRRRASEYAARISGSEHEAQHYAADLAAHRIEAEGLAEQIRLAGESEAVYRGLVDKGLASKVRLIEATEHRVEATWRLDTNRGEQQTLIQQIAQAEANRDAFVAEWNRKLAEDLAKARSDRDGTAARLAKARRRHEMAVLTASADAIVLEVAKRPPGTVVREAETLMRLVPAGAPLVAELQVDTRDVGRLAPGDPVTLKLEALPWQQFGLAHGLLRTITPDALEDESERATADAMASPELRAEAHQSPIHYRARIELTETRFRNLPAGFELRPGMRLVGDIKVGRRSVLDYVLNPITRVIDESLREP